MDKQDKKTALSREIPQERLAKAQETIKKTQELISRFPDGRKLTRYYPKSKWVETSTLCR